MTARKPAPKPARWQDRAVRSARAHPFVTWGTAASAVTVIAAIITGVLWVDGRYQLAEAAGAHERNHRQERAEILYQLARQESLILRNRLNDCASRVQRSTQADRQVCEQYRGEYREAERRSQILYEQVQRGGR